MQRTPVQIEDVPSDLVPAPSSAVSWSIRDCSALLMDADQSSQHTMFRFDRPLLCLTTSEQFGVFAESGIETVCHFMNLISGEEIGYLGIQGAPLAVTAVKLSRET